MSGHDEKLSAFLDGEVTDAEARQIETALAQDPALRAELDSLMAATAGAQDVFHEMLDEPVPLALAAAIKTAPDPAPVANRTAQLSASKFRWGTFGAALLCVLVGTTGGYITGRSDGLHVAAASGWLDDVADYHRVYAAQDRHLVEVPAAEALHIQSWLTASIGAAVTIPDFTAQGLTFQGARLLVAAGKPVSQLIYTDAQNRVVALCQIQTGTPREGLLVQTVDTFDMITWGGAEADFVIFGDAGRGDLLSFAQAAQDQA